MLVERSEIEMKKLRTVYYARVSTDSDDQLHSLKAQQEYFDDYLKYSPEYELVGAYVDEGITGTSIKKRTKFKKMINDALHHHFDIIITKEVTRFARNTLDALKMIRLLKEHDVNVIFLTDGIDTRTHEGEIRLSIMATIAQEESRKTSQRVNWGFQRKYEKEELILTSIYGYDIKEVKENNKKKRILVINEQEAKVVKKIYHWYLQGYGYSKIRDKLYDQHVPTPKGNKRWDTSVISKILSNEKYIGRLVQRKQRTNNHLDKKVIRDIPRNQMYISENHHEAIIDPSVFYQVQKIKADKKKTGERNNAYALSGKIVCPKCGMTFGRIKYGKNRKKVGWKCRGLDKKLCTNTSMVNETVLKELLKTFLSTVFINKEKTKKEIIHTLMQSYYFLDNEREINQLNRDIGEIKRNINLYLDDYLEGKITVEEYKTKKSKEEKIILQKEKELYLLNKESNTDEMRQSIDRMITVINEKIEIDTDILNRIIKQSVKTIIPKQTNEYEIYLDFKNEYFKEDISLNQFEYVMTYEFDLERLESPFWKNNMKKLRNTKLHLYVRRK